MAIDVELARGEKLTATERKTEKAFSEPSPKRFPGRHGKPGVIGAPFIPAFWVNVVLPPRAPRFANPNGLACWNSSH
jgi:hypothetical protein